MSRPLIGVVFGNCHHSVETKANMISRRADQTPNQPLPEVKPEADGHQMRELFRRISTFKGMTMSASPISLSKAGFYLSAPGIVTCCSCRITIEISSLESKLSTQSHSPGCTFVGSHKEAAISAAHVHADEVGATGTVKDMMSNTSAISCMPPPKIQSNILISRRNPDKEFLDRMKNSEAARLETFYDFPDACIITKGELCDAGFFFTGQLCHTQCAHCMGTVTEWNAWDVPKQVHATKFPECPFVRSQQNRNSQNGEVNIASSREAPQPAPPSADLSKSQRKRLRKKQNNDRLPTSNNPRPEESSVSAQEPKGSVLQNTTGDNKTSSSTSPVTGATQSSADQECDNLLQENTLLKEARLCKICFDNAMDVVFLPCGHAFCCTPCAAAVHQCPLCRTYIKATVNVLPGDDRDKDSPSKAFN